MINTKMMVGAIALASTLLVGCSKSDAIDTGASIAAQLSQISADVKIAKAEAERANQRLDNLTRGSYKK